ncbi:YadA C-terminal domain-containing protein [Escherichia coli]
MSKKFTKTILSSAVAGLMLVSVNSFAQVVAIGDYKIIVDDTTESARIVHAKDNKDIFTGVINIKNGMITTVNTDEVNAAIDRFSKKNPDLVKDKSVLQMVAQVAGEAARYSISLPPEFPSITEGNLQNITVADIEKIKSNIDGVNSVITSKTAKDYNIAISNGMSSEAALTAAKDGNGALLQEFNRLGTNVNDLKNATTFALDENGEITDGQGVESVSVKSVVADVKADTTIYQNKDGSYTLDQSAPGNVRVNDAVVSLDNRTRSNTQAIQNHSRQLQEHNARLNSQQRQIRENHEEMKRAAAQSAALSGLFQPYSVGKFNATAALGGYSDKQAVAVGVGYRFNEQTAAKAGIAASDGDVSYNVGVNFEF